MQYRQQHGRAWALPIFVVIAAGFIGMLASTVAADLIVFGDSLSDVGNIYKLTTRFTRAPDIPDPQAGYFSGRFSDGPIWVDRLASRLGESPLVSSLNGGTNYAYGSARVLEDGLLAPRLSQQIKMHTNGIQKTDWFVIWAGANDLQNAELNDLPKSLQIAKDAATEIKASVDRLYEQGARQLLVMNLPDSSRLPYTVLMVDQATRDNLFRVTTVFNEELDRQLSASRVVRPDLRLVTFDANRWFQDVVSSPLSYGLTNVTESAAPFYSNGLLAGLAKEPPRSADVLNTHAFFDGLHPTSYLHGLLGDRVADALLVPEPNSFVLGMVTFLWVVNSRRFASGMKDA